MKISTKGRYGLRLMVDLAVHYEQGLVPLKEIAVRQEISEKYLEQIMMQLNRSGLVRSVRGAQGGYCLAQPPESITVGAVLRVMEGSLAPVDCVPGLRPDGPLRHRDGVAKAEGGGGGRGGRHHPAGPGKRLLPQKSPGLLYLISFISIVEGRHTDG